MNNYQLGTRCYYKFLQAKGAFVLVDFAGWNNGLLLVIAIEVR